MPYPGQLHLVVATCVVVYDGKALILKRSPREVAYPGKWSIPGGKIDRAEYSLQPKRTRDAWASVVEETLRREVQEEAGLTIAEPNYLGSYAFIRPDTMAVVGLNFWAEALSQHVVLAQEFDAFEWVGGEAAASFDMIEGVPGVIAQGLALATERTA